MHNEDKAGEVGTDYALIPDKKYFKIGEVCEIIGVKQHVLRYWESEFKTMIRPQRASSKQRLYRRVDVENILRIKKLLKEDGFTIPGAKKLLAREKKRKSVPRRARGEGQQAFLTGLKKELLTIQKILKDG